MTGKTAKTHRGNAALEALDELERRMRPAWVHNAALTGDIEALRRIALTYADWWNDVAFDLVEAPR